MAEPQTVISRPAPYLEAAGQTFLDLLTAKTGQAPTAAEISALSPQVAGQNVLTQQAQQQAATQAGLGALTFDPTTGAVTGAGQGTGIAGYQPFLQQAQQYSGPGAYQQFMSPYQQDVINTTLSEFDRQRQIAAQAIPAAAIQAGAFGGGREGVQRAEFGSESLRNRAALQAQLLQQGYQAAQQAAGTAFSQQQQLAAIQPTLAAQTSQQLGAAGTSNLAYQQAVLDAQRQAAQFAYQEPYQRLSVLGSGITSLLQGQPSAPYSQQVTPSFAGGAGAGVSPLSQALSTAANVYGLGSIFGGK
jgi:hypothetical protein